MENRWNYYKILQVQPDAPLEVIQQNYLLLLKKLKKHPDMAEHEWDVRMLNIAYETLSDPEKRARYNLELLGHQNIESLSLGTLTPRGLFTGQKNSPPALPSENRRNYYRVLEVHPDAHPTVIRERYLSMVTRSGTPRELLDAAYSVLNHPSRRREYDRLLKQYDHVRAVRIMEADKSGPSELVRQKAGKKKDIVPPSYGSALFPADNHIGNGLQVHPSAGQVEKAAGPEVFFHSCYNTTGTVFCPFCGMPHSLRPVETHTDKICEVCHSPLFFNEEAANTKNGRICDRIRKAESVIFYVCWPGDKLHAKLIDISPAGVRIESRCSLNPGQIIKIEGKSFSAVGEVVYSRLENEPAASGIKFISMLFSSVKGSFLSTSV